MHHLKKLNLFNLNGEKTMLMLVLFQNALHNLLIFLLVLFEQEPIYGSWLPPIRGAEIVDFVRNYMDGISWNLQSLSPY